MTTSMHWIQVERTVGQIQGLIDRTSLKADDHPKTNTKLI